ncbi:hypothetical protein JHK86_052654 [Glycine max]|nr:hypothetical protein JHK86_052654 [Glycine max]
MAEKKNKRIKSIRHRPTTPRMEKEKETTKSGPSGRGKWIAHFPSPPTTPKETPWLKKLVEMKSTYYNNLVKVFYTITHIYGDTGFLCTEVKGQQIMMTQMVWLDIDGLSSKEVMAYQLGLKEARFAFNKVEKYKPTMKTPFYLCCCYKSKRKEMFWGSNHAQLTEEDLLLISLMQRKLKINWVNIIIDIMLKTKRIDSSKYPYVVLISRIIDYFGVDNQEEVFGFVEAEFEVKTKSLEAKRDVQGALNCGFEKVSLGVLEGSGGGHVEDVGVGKDGVGEGGGIEEVNGEEGEVGGGEGEEVKEMGGVRAREDGGVDGVVWVLLLQEDLEDEASSSPKNVLQDNEDDCYGMYT